MNHNSGLRIQTFNNICSSKLDILRINILNRINFTDRISDTGLTKYIEDNVVSIMVLAKSILFVMGIGGDNIKCAFIIKDGTHDNTIIIKHIDEPLDSPYWLKIVVKDFYFHLETYRTKFKQYDIESFIHECNNLDDVRKNMLNIAEQLNKSTSITWTFNPRANSLSYMQDSYIQLR